ncbi:DNA methylase [Escherichia coli]|nr:DNA methylase [Escherichia coli]
MSRFIQGDCVRVMATFPGNAVDCIQTDPHYLGGLRDGQGRTNHGDKNAEGMAEGGNERDSGREKKGGRGGGP